jgi:hypothetical protein
VAAGFCTFPVVVPLVLLGWAAKDFGHVGNWLVAAMASWLGNGIAIALAGTGFVLGWWHRREIEVRGAPPVDAGLARAGEILGAVVGLYALALLLGAARMAP